MRDAIAWLIAVVLCAAGATAAPESDCVGLTNQHVGLTLRKSDGALLSIHAPDGRNLLATNARASLWSVEVIPDGTTKPVTLTADKPQRVAFTSSSGPAGRTLRGVYEVAGTNSTVCTVKIEIALRADSPCLRWRLVGIETKGGKLWSVTYPQIPVGAFDADLADNEMVIPYRRGQVRAFGKGAPRSDIPLPYPGPAAKFQFLAAYGKVSGRGFYYAAEDGASYTKTFWLKNNPAANAIILGTQHFPENRGADVRRWRMPYEIVTRPFEGDWWHAARIYREWWVKQVWASKGLIEHRADVPDWVKRSPIIARFSTTKPGRKVADNVASVGLLNQTLNCAPFIGVWYGYPQVPHPEKGLDHWGHGCLLPPQPGVVEALRDLRAQDIHTMAYIQSIILTADMIGDDRPAAEGAVTRNLQGKMEFYREEGAGSAGLWAMCRASPWWQSRMVEMARRAVGECGFRGVYLDSFGKGAAECFATNHGHPLGGGNTVVSGQRVMAERVRRVIRATDREAIMSGEDPIEAFRDLLDVPLYAVNAMPGYVPIYRTVWGDYSLGHGRSITPRKDSNPVIPELATLFLEGTIMGRFFCDSPNHFILQPEYAKELAFLRPLLNYTRHGLPWLRFGEYLHPLKLSPAPPTIEFRESTQNLKTQVPVVMHSVTRSHSDGTVAIVLINIGDKAEKVRVPINSAALGAAKGELLRMNEEGKLTPLSSGRTPWTQELEIKPFEVLFLVLR